LQSAPFDLRLRKERVSKVGDFTSRPGKARASHQPGQPPFLFLITYIHEVAHLMVHLEHGWKVKSHGHSWKEKFQQLMDPLLTEVFFPPEFTAGAQTPYA